MNRESAKVYKTSIENFCGYCNKPSRFGIANYQNGSEWPVCKECALTRIRKLKFKKSKHLPSQNQKQTILEQDHIGNSPENSPIIQNSAKNTKIEDSEPNTPESLQFKTALQIEQESKKQ